MNKIIWSSVSVVILGVFVWTAVFLYNKSQEKPVIFETATPFVTDIVKKTVATGKILPRKEVDIKPQVSGVVDKLFVEAGTDIKKGDLIARIQLIPDMEHLNGAESRLEIAELNMENAKEDLDRNKKLFSDGLISEFDFKKFKLEYEISEENVRSAENNVALIKEGASKKSGQVSNLVRATAEGTVLDVPVKEGSFVIESNTFNEGTTIASIANMNDMIFEGMLDESEVGKVKPGMGLQLDVGAIEGASFGAQLEYVSPKGMDDQGTIKFEVRAAIDSTEEYFLRAGYSANANIVMDKRDQVLAINEGNLIVEEGVTFVEVETSEQEFERKEITTGISDGINIEIVSGITEETKIKKLIN